MTVAVIVQLNAVAAVYSKRYDAEVDGMWFVEVEEMCSV